MAVEIYDGTPIPILASGTLRYVAVDSAGNYVEGSADYVINILPKDVDFVDTPVVGAFYITYNTQDFFFGINFAGRTTIQGNPSFAIKLVGASRGLSRLSTGLTAKVNLAGAARTSSNIAGQVLGSINLAGNSRSLALANGGIDTQIDLLSNLICDTKLAGTASDLEYVPPADIKFADVPYVRGNFVYYHTEDFLFEGSALCSSAVGEATLDTEILLSDSLVSNSILQADLSSFVKLQGVSSGSSTLSSELSALPTLYLFSALATKSLLTADLTNLINLESALAGKTAIRALLKDSFISQFWVNASGSISTTSISGSLGTQKISGTLGRTLIEGKIL